MYSPSYFNEPSAEKSYEWMRAYPFATLITPSAELQVSHLPLILRVSSEGKATLVGHMARANPHWKAMEQGETTVIFHGPHTYITPSWYPTPEDVPTWNYLAVHVKVKARIISDPNILHEDLRELVDISEKKYSGSWSLDAVSSEFLGDLSKGIVGFHLEIQSVQAKVKMNQNRPQEDRDGVKAGLGSRQDENSREVLRLMGA